MNEKRKYLAFVIILINLLFAASVSISQVTDIDGNTYKTVIIGTQEWTAENLNVEHYRNGDVIPQVKNPDEWSKLTTGAWCYYDNDPADGKTYGKLYNWYAVNDSRGLAPEGWHIPSDAEWTQLIDFLGGEEIAGGKLKATTTWDSPNRGATNESGFTAYQGNDRNFTGKFLGGNSFFWSSSEDNDGNPMSYYLNFLGSDVNRHIGRKTCGFSVRCVRD